MTPEIPQQPLPLTGLRFSEVDWHAVRAFPNVTDSRDTKRVHGVLVDDAIFQDVLAKLALIDAPVGE